MALLAEVELRIKSNSKKVETELSGIQKSIQKLQLISKQAFKAFAISAGVAATAMGGILVAVNHIAEGIDNLAKTSSKLGIPVGELQKLQFQAQLAGVSVNTLNMALQRSTRRIGEAAQGLGEAKGALKELGLDAQELNKVDPSVQFNKIVDALRKVENQSDRVRLAFKLFDSEGVSVINALNVDLKKTGKEFDALGLAITDSQAKAVEAFNDSKTELSTIFGAFGQQFTASVAPALEYGIKQVKEFIKETGGLAPIAQKAAITFVQGFKAISMAVVGVINFFTRLSGIVESITNKFIRVALLLKQSFLDFIPGLSISDLKEIDRIKAVTTPVSSQSIIDSRNKSLEQFNQKLDGIISKIGVPEVKDQKQSTSVNITVKTDKHSIVDEFMASPSLDAFLNKKVERIAAQEAAHTS